MALPVAGEARTMTTCRGNGVALLAQLVEQLTLNQRVEGSSPSGGISIGARISGLFSFLDAAFVLLFGCLVRAW